MYDENFVLPSHGTFEFDYIYLLNPPHQDEQTSDEKLDMMKDLILSFESDVNHQIMAFKALSEYMVLSSTQLGDFIDLVDDPKWKIE